MSSLNKLGLCLGVSLLGALLTGCGNDTAEKQAPAKDGERSLVIATEANYPPFNNTTSDGKIVGFDVDVINAVCDEIKAKCTIIAQEWDGLLPGLLTQKYDAVIAGMSITPERLQQVDFSEPYFSNTIVWLAKNDGSFDPNHIKNLVLGSQRATTGADYISQKYDGKDGNRVQLYDTYTNAYLDLKAGRNNAVMAEKVSASDWLAQNSDGFGLVGEEIDNNDNLGIAVRKGDPLKGEFDRALATLKASGKLGELEKANFGAQSASAAADKPADAQTDKADTADKSDKTDTANNPTNQPKASS